MRPFLCIVLVSLVLAACGGSEEPASAPTCERAAERDAFCASADVAKRAFVCPADLPRFPDGCGDGTPNDGAAVVLCCP
jgi:hypothetical protein